MNKKRIGLILCVIVCAAALLTAGLLFKHRRDHRFDSVLFYNFDFSKSWFGSTYPLDTLPKGDGNDVFPDEESFLEYASRVLENKKKGWRKKLWQKDLSDSLRENIHVALDWEIISITLDENLGVWGVYFNTLEYTGDPGVAYYYSMKTGEYLGYEMPE